MTRKKKRPVPRRGAKTPVETEPAFQKIVFIPDTHVPYHDRDAFRLALKVVKKFRPHMLVILGDFADFYSVSQHEKDPNRRISLIEEVAVVKEKLDELTAACPRKTRRIYVSGNHEYRLDRYIRDKAPDLFGLTTVDAILELNESGWEYVPYKDYIKIGNLLISHDTGSAGMNAHRRSLSDAGSGNSVVIGHTHRMSWESKTTAEGDFVSAAMFGWLGNAEEIDYMHKTKVNNWVHGLGLGYLMPNGTVVTRPIPFVNNECVLGDKLIRLEDK